MRNLLSLSSLALALTGFLQAPAALAQQTEGNWMVRARVLSVEPANNYNGKHAATPDNSVDVSNKIYPELDISYFFSKNIAAELILTVPQKHSVKVNGMGKIGNFKLLPPSLLLQYHFNPEGTFRPYVGAGITYALFSKEKMTAGGDVTLENDSLGAAFQLGFDVKVGANSFINFDVKKLQIRTDVRDSVLGKLGHEKVDPLVWGVGYGMRF